MYLIKLLRPLNLAIIAITMYGLGWFLEFYTNQLGEIKSSSFLLLVLSTVMIAGAGNIINDYFDVRADRVNKPEKLIIGKHVKRRTAIASHWIINFVSFGIAVYLSWKFNTFWYLFIHLLTINLLWYYSTYFKKKFLIGNLLVAGMTALVPILVGFYFYHILQINDIELEGAAYSSIEKFAGLKQIIGSIALFALLINLAREIVKDIEDVEGDKILKSKSIPIVLGARKSKSIIVVIILITVSLLSTILVLYNSVMFTLLPLALISLLLLIIAMTLIILAKNKKEFRRVNNCLKLAMIAGILLPIYFRFFTEITI